MKKIIGLFLFLGVLSLAAGYARTAGPAPQSAGSIGPAGFLASSDGLETTSLLCGEETPENGAEETEGGEDGTLEVYEIAAEEETPGLTLEEVRAVRFGDVPDGDPRAAFVGYVVCRSYLEGVDGDRFDPDGYVTRASLAAVLHRMSGAAESNTAIAFLDMDSGAWYADAVSWAAENGVVTGTADGSFEPQKPVTREQLAVFLYRFAAEGGGQAASETLAAYRDGGEILAYAREPMAWALENGIFAGMVGDTIHRSLPVSRGQLAQVLTAFDAYAGTEPVAGVLAEQLQAAAIESVSLAKHEDIQSKVDAVAAKYGAVGLQVAVIESGQVTDAYAYGWATKGSDRMTPNHKTRIASITKVGVGLAAMALYEDGVADLDQSIGAYWGVSAKNPYYPDDPVTIRTLLTHTSSLAALGDDASQSREAVQSRLQSGGYAQIRPRATSSWRYNNYAFGVLGQTLEIAAGAYLDEVMEDHFWKIMEIDAAFESGNVKNHDLLCTVYQYGGVGRSLPAMKSNTRRYHPPGATGAYFAGGMTMSAIGLGKMTALLANDGRYEGLQLLKADTVEMMEVRCEPQLPDGTYQALALRSQDDLYGRDILYYHTGSAYGVFNCMSYDPETGDGVVVLTSGASGAKDSRGIYAVCGEISQYIYDAIAQ